MENDELKNSIINYEYCTHYAVEEIMTNKI